MRTLGTFKRWDGLGMNSLKNLTFRGGVHEKPIYRGDCLKKGVLDSLQI